MSRVANNPITLPKGVEVTLGSVISVKGPLGAMKPGDVGRCLGRAQ
jgi:large subunit ribosomal protein L6